jgi:hypothetical protein
VIEVDEEDSEEEAGVNADVDGIVDSVIAEMEQDEESLLYKIGASVSDYELKDKKYCK